MPTSIDDRVRTVHSKVHIRINAQSFPMEQNKIEKYEKKLFIFLNLLLFSCMPQPHHNLFINIYQLIENCECICKSMVKRTFQSTKINTFWKVLNSTISHSLFFSCWRSSTEVYSTILGSFSFCFRLFLDFSSYTNENECHHTIFFALFCCALCSVKIIKRMHGVATVQLYNQRKRKHQYQHRHKHYLHFVLFLAQENENALTLNFFACWVNDFWFIFRHSSCSFH